MKFGYSTNAFVNFPVFEAVEKISRLGFGGVEILCDRPHLYPPDFPPEEVDRLKAWVESRGLKVTNLNSFTLFAVGDMYLPSWIEASPERRRVREEHTRSCLRLAARLGCSNISVPPGGPLDGASRKEALSLFHRGIEKVAPLAEELRVKILVEPEPRLLLENSGQFKEFIREVRSPFVGLNFDVGHFFCAGEDPILAFRDLFYWIGHIHLEDIAPDRAHNHLIPGLGALDFRGIFQAVRESGYGGDMSLELYPYVDRPVEAGRESLQHLIPIFRQTQWSLPDLGVSP